MEVLSLRDDEVVDYITKPSVRDSISSNESRLFTDEEISATDRISFKPVVSDGDVVTLTDEERALIPWMSQCVNSFRLGGGLPSYLQNPSGRMMIRQMMIKLDYFLKEEHENFERRVEALKEREENAEYLQSAVEAHHEQTLPQFSTMEMIPEQHTCVTQEEAINDKKESGLVTRAKTTVLTNGRVLNKNRRVRIKKETLEKPSFEVVSSHMNRTQRSEVLTRVITDHAFLEADADYSGVSDACIDNRDVDEAVWLALDQRCRELDVAHQPLVYVCDPYDKQSIIHALHGYAIDLDYRPGAARDPRRWKNHELVCMPYPGVTTDRVYYESIDPRVSIIEVVNYEAAQVRFDEEAKRPDRTLVNSKEYHYSTRKIFQTLRPSLRLMTNLDTNKTAALVRATVYMDLTPRDRIAVDAWPGCGTSVFMYDHEYGDD